MILIDAYFEFLISGFLQFEYEPRLSYHNEVDGEKRQLYFTFKNTEYTGDVISIIFASIGLVLVLVVLPTCFWWMLLQDLETLRSYEFRRLWGSLYEDLKTSEF
jgi:hypothetical protein